MQTKRTTNSIHSMDIAPENAQNAFSEHHTFFSLQSGNYMLCDEITVYRSLSNDDQSCIDANSDSGVSVLSPNLLLVEFATLLLVILDIQIQKIY